MNESILKPCPFCGELPVKKFDDMIKWYIDCSSSTCGPNPGISGYHLEAEAVVMWNTRADKKISEWYMQGFQDGRMDAIKKAEKLEKAIEDYFIQRGHSATGDTTIEYNLRTSLDLYRTDK